MATPGAADPGKARTAGADCTLVVDEADLTAKCEADPTACQIAVAISGGGYRATAWGLGVLWCLADTARNADVTMISSVSGGSIVNAHAGLGAPYRQLSGDDYATAAKALAARLRGNSTSFLAALILSVLAAAGSAILLAQGNIAAGLVVAGVGVAVGALGAAGSRDLVFGRWETWLYLDVLLALTVLVVWAWPQALVVIGVIAALAVVALARGPVIGWSIGRTLQTLCPGRSTLADLNIEPMHVFLATELRAGHHACFARDFVYCYDLGLGAKATIPVRTAVQASANLPGAFPTRWIRATGIGFVGGEHSVGWLAVSDGGVYDNMADQWPIGLRRRIERLASQPDVGAEHAVLKDWENRNPTFVIVANASGALGFRKVAKGAIPLVGELLGLLQVKDVLYDNGNSVRRSALITDFDSDEPAGTLIHIASNPYDYPDKVHGRATEAADQQLVGRADAAIDYLACHGGARADWQATVHQVQKVGTQLWPLGPRDTDAIVRAAYCQTMVNLHLKLGVDLHDPPDLVT